MEGKILIYEKTKSNCIFISLLIFSVLCSLAILFTPYKIHSAGLRNYLFLSGIGFHPEYAIVIVFPLFLVIMSLILIPLSLLTFGKQFTSIALRNMRRLLLSGSVMGIILSVVVTYFFNRNVFPGINRYTVIVGLPYVYFILIIILSAVALSKRNLPKLFFEVKSD